MSIKNPVCRDATALWSPGALSYVDAHTQKYIIHTCTLTSIKPIIPPCRRHNLSPFPLFHFFTDFSPLLYVFNLSVTLLLSSPAISLLLCSITTSHGTPGHREAKHTGRYTSLPSVTLHTMQPNSELQDHFKHCLCAQVSSLVCHMKSVAELVRCVGVRNVAGFETISERCVTQELRMVKKI